jgi:hypothetical protein
MQPVGLEPDMHQTLEVKDERRLETTHHHGCDAHERHRPGTLWQPEPQRLQHCSTGSFELISMVASDA